MQEGEKDSEQEDGAEEPGNDASMAAPAPLPDNMCSVVTDVVIAWGVTEGFHPGTTPEPQAAAWVAYARAHGFAYAPGSRFSPPHPHIRNSLPVSGSCNSVPVHTPRYSQTTRAQSKEMLRLNAKMGLRVRDDPNDMYAFLHALTVLAVMRNKFFCGSKNGCVNPPLALPAAHGFLFPLLFLFLFLSPSLFLFLFLLLSLFRFRFLSLFLLCRVPLACRTGFGLCRAGARSGMCGTVARRCCLWSATSSSVSSGGTRPSESRGRCVRLPCTHAHIAQGQVCLRNVWTRRAECRFWARA